MPDRMDVSDRSVRQRSLHRNFRSVFLATVTSVTAHTKYSAARAADVDADLLNDARRNFQPLPKDITRPSFRSRLHGLSSAGSFFLRSANLRRRDRELRLLTAPAAIMLAKVRRPLPKIVLAIHGSSPLVKLELVTGSLNWLLEEVAPTTPKTMVRDRNIIIDRSVKASSRDESRFAIGAAPILLLLFVASNVVLSHA